MTETFPLPPLLYPFLPLRGLAERPQIKSPPATCFVLSGFTSRPLLRFSTGGEIRGLFKRDPRMEVCHRDSCTPSLWKLVSPGTVTRGLLGKIKLRSMTATFFLSFLPFFRLAFEGVGTGVQIDLSRDFERRIVEWKDSFLFLPPFSFFLFLFFFLSRISRYRTKRYTCWRILRFFHDKKQLTEARFISVR